MNDDSVLILMVEDDTDIHLIVREFLGLPGHRAKLLSALTVEEGLKHFRAYREQISFIILDASLTRYVRRIDTLPILEEIKTTGFPRPVISSSSDHELREQMRSLGCTDAVEKGSLLNILRHYL